MTHDLVVRSTRRHWLARVAAVATLGAPLSGLQAQTAAAPLRIGYQKSASLLALQKTQGTLEKRLAPLGVTVRWVEFPAGPQLLEGLNLSLIHI